MGNHHSKKPDRSSYVISGMSRSIESNSTTRLAAATTTAIIANSTAMNTASSIRSGTIGAERLLVRCLLCGETNIQRCHYQNHEKTCTKRIVSCLAADMKCTWKGTKDELIIHSNNCTFEKLRPIIDELKNELQNTVDTLKDQVDFLLKVINKGNLMTQECTMPMNECKYNIRITSDATRKFNCSICNQYVQHEEISLHTCVDTQYQNNDDESFIDDNGNNMYEEEN